MKTPLCRMTSLVLKAIDQDRLEVFPELSAHYAECEACQDAARHMLRLDVLDCAAEAIAEADRLERIERRSSPDLRIAGDRLIHPPPAGDEPDLDPNEVALLLSGFAPSALDVDALPPRARDRLYAAAVRIDASAPDEPSVVERLGLTPPAPAQSAPELGQPLPEPMQPLPEPVQPPGPDAPTRPSTPSPWPMLAAAAAVILTAIGLGPLPDGTGRGGPPAGPSRTATTQWAEVTVFTAERRCDGVVFLDGAGIGDPKTGQPLPDHLTPGNPCRYHPRENLGLVLRVEPGAGFRHLSVLGRAADGRVEVLHTSQGPRGTALVMTRERVTTGCGDGACWLGDGPLDVPTGPLEVVAIFSDTALPLDAMRRTWAPMQWTGSDRLVQRFGIQVDDEERGRLE